MVRGAALQRAGQAPGSKGCQRHGNQRGTSGARKWGPHGSPAWGPLLAECVQGASSADGELLRTGGPPGSSGRRLRLVPLWVAWPPCQQHDKCPDVSGLSYTPPRTRNLRP